MEEKILVIKGEMQTYFDQDGKAFPVTLLAGREVKLGELFKEGDRLVVSGISKGKGFAGVVKRYHFAGGPRTHGQSDRERARGSSGSTTTPGRVMRGKRMAGRMGGDKVTIKNLLVSKIDTEKNVILVKGAVPGPKKCSLLIRKSVLKT